MCLEVPLRAGSAPICAHSGAVCHSLPLAELLDRVIQQSARVQGISNDLHSEFVSPFTFLHALVFFSSTAVSLVPSLSLCLCVFEQLNVHCLRLKQWRIKLVYFFSSSFFFKSQIGRASCRERV